MINNVKLTFTV